MAEVVDMEEPAINQPAAQGPVAARAALLRDELDRFLAIVLPWLQPEKVIANGSFATGSIGEWSDLDLVVIAATDLPFFERSKLVIERVRPRTGLDIAVYTPAEWTELQSRPFIQEEIIEKGRVIYGR